jgi:molecular chaperone DnaJ
MDLYSLLGIARSASSDEIERAYRRLARRYHPGVNPGDRVAEERYRRVQQAYEVLGDEQRRTQYDRGGAAPAQAEASVAFEGFDFTAPAESRVAATFAELFAGVFQEAARQATTPARGVAIETTLQLSFEDAVRGGSFPLSVTRQDRCPACQGEGRVARPAVVCPACEGQGTSRWVRGHMVFNRSCDSCGGAGRLVTQACRSCGGAGVQARSDVVTVAVPPGIEDGARVVVPARGHAGRGGGTPGDLYVAIEVADHPHFRRVGRDLYLTLPVAIHEAVLGGRVDVPTFGGPVKLRIPPGTPSGQRLRLRGRGVPAASGRDEDAGDLLVEIQIVLPPIRDERSKELLREFGRLNGADVRAGLFGE